MILYACADLIFATKVRSTAESLGVRTRPVRDADMLTARLDRVDDGKCNDPVSALLVDLDLDAGPDLIRRCKAHSPAVPVVAFGSHVATAVLAAAEAAGADHVLSRGTFTAQLPTILTRLGVAV